MHGSFLTGVSIFCFWMFCLHESVTLHVCLMPTEVGSGIGSPETGVADDCEVPCGCLFSRKVCVIIKKKSICVIQLIGGTVGFGLFPARYISRDCLFPLGNDSLTNARSASSRAPRLLSWSPWPAAAEPLCSPKLLPTLASLAPSLCYFSGAQSLPNLPVPEPGRIPPPSPILSQVQFFPSGPPKSPRMENYYNRQP